MNGAESSLMHDSNKSMLKFANDDYNRELNTFTTAGSGMKGNSIIKLIFFKLKFFFIIIL